MSSNWPPAFPAIRFNYQSQGNGVYRIWHPEILEAAPVVPADKCGLVTEDICLGEILAMAGLPHEGMGRVCRTWRAFDLYGLAGWLTLLAILVF